MLHMRYQLQVINRVEDISKIVIGDWFGFDLETTGLDPYTSIILLMAICTDSDTYVIDFTKIDIGYAQLLRGYFEDKLVLGANLTFDYKMLYYHTGIRIKHMSDVMLNEQLLSAGKFVPPIGKARPFSLAAITHRRLDITLDKDVRQEFIEYNGTLSEQAYEYAGMDTTVLKPIYDQQMSEIKLHELNQVYQLECALIPVTAHMELLGVEIDREGLKQLESPFNRHIATSERVFQDMLIANGGAETIVCSDTYYCVNSSSKPQVIRALNLCGVEIDNLDSKKLAKWDLKRSKRAIDLSMIMNMLEQDEADVGEAIEHFGGYSNPYLRAYSFLVGAEKLVSAYIVGLQNKLTSNNIFRPWFKQLGARSTGRYSSNAQQLPKDDKLDRLGLKYSIRKNIVARKGKVFIIADYSAIELVILADMSGDEKLAYEHSRGDLHTLVCNEILYKIWPIAGEVTKKNAKEDGSKYKVVREASKTVSYSIAYGITGKGLADRMNVQVAGLGLKLTPEQAEWIIEQWKKLFEKAGKFLEESATMAVTKGYTTSILGRKRWYDLNYIFGNKWAYLAAKREGSNQRIQSTSADMTKRAMLYFYNIAPQDKMQIALTVHDELVVECDEQYADIGVHFLKSAMELSAQSILINLGNSVIIEPAISRRYDK